MCKIITFDFYRFISYNNIRSNTSMFSIWHFFTI